MRRFLLLSLAAAFGLGSLRVGATEAPVHGLWVWKRSSVLEPVGSAETLRDFAKTNGITEIYLSISIHDHLMEDAPLVALIDLLHQASIRVEALLDSIDADQPGKPREALLGLARSIVQFNEAQAHSRFDGIHLDIEPHQRAENKGPGNLRFLPGLLETFRGVREIAAPAHLTVNADIPNKLLKGDAAQRRGLLTSVDRVTLMLYELSSPDDGTATDAKSLKLQRAAEKYLSMAYAGLDDPNVAGMVIALRTKDYGESLQDMLKSLDEHQIANSRYLGWARHCYNDLLNRRTRRPGHSADIPGSKEPHSALDAPTLLNFRPGGKRLACAGPGHGTRIWEHASLK